MQKSLVAERWLRPFINFDFYLRLAIPPLIKSKALTNHAFISSKTSKGASDAAKNNFSEQKGAK
jgi:hypothetical protein